MQLVYIVWEDAKVIKPHAWNEHEEWNYIPYLIHQAGWLLYENNEGVVITEAWSEELVGPVSQIPKCCIKEMKVLHEI